MTLPAFHPPRIGTGERYRGLVCTVSTCLVLFRGNGQVYVLFVRADLNNDSAMHTTAQLWCTAALSSTVWQTNGCGFHAWCALGSVLSATLMYRRVSVLLAFEPATVNKGAGECWGP
jgi:hypothetical protein